MSHNWTVEQVEYAIHLALQDRNMTAVAELLRLLAIKAPDHAQLIMDAVEAARADKGGVG